MFTDLVRYKEMHGDCTVPHKWPENLQLSNWVGTQRTKRDRLTEERRSRLEALGFDWDPIASFWEKMFAELVGYKEVHGDCNVPRGWPENLQLATWVGTQRTKKETLTADRVSRLEALGFDWDPRATAWEKMFAELVGYKEAHGDCNVQRGWSENSQLARWVTNQRTKRDRLTEDRRARLEALGFDWAPIAAIWPTMFTALVQYKEMHGDCNVPRGWSENPQLGNWVGKQRQSAKKGKMTDDRRLRLRLEEIGFQF